MRLIDATDLKKAVIEFFDGVHLCDVNGADIIQDINSIIEKAPTVEDRTREVLSQQKTIRKLTKERPRGKWLNDGHASLYYICSNCGGGGDHYDNYCRICGAQMTEGATDDEI